jgi:hypothetical protein
VVSVDVVTDPSDPTVPTSPDSPTSPSPEPSPERPALSLEQKRQIRDDGYTLLRQAVPPERVGAALRAINGAIGGHGIEPAQLDTFRSRSWCPEIASDPAIVGLLTDTPLWDLAESAIGPGTLDPVDSGQIALRFPTAADPVPVHPHLDGMYTPHNGVPKGEIWNFTALVGVYLSDVPTPDAGNFTVWPGSHRRYEDYFATEGPDAILRGMPPIDIGEPLQVTPSAGDAVLSHYQIGHGIASNASPHIRYAIYFRLRRAGHDAIRREVMSDLWREWDGMRELVGSARLAG